MAYTRHTPWPVEDGTFRDEEADPRVPRAIRAMRRERREREHRAWRARNPELAAMADDFERALLDGSRSALLDHDRLAGKTVDWSVAEAVYAPFATVGR
jgi:hypothetical protein